MSKIGKAAARYIQQLAVKSLNILWFLVTAPLGRKHRSRRKLICLKKKAHWGVEERKEPALWDEWAFSLSDIEKKSENDNTRDRNDQLLMLWNEP